MSEAVGCNGVPDRFFPSRDESAWWPMTNAKTWIDVTSTRLNGFAGWLRPCGFAAVAIAFAVPSPALLAQSKALPNAHYFLDAKGEPGVVAGAAIARRVPGVGSYQAVEVAGPKGVQVALAREGQFLPTLEAPVKVGMIVGAVYRVRVTGIPFRPGEELYPTIEVIDRVHAPSGREHRFPIPVVLEEADLRSALDGALVTRVIYLEDSELADPIAVQPNTQAVLDVGPMDNALKSADQLGRPVAILRIGSRVPANLQGDLTDFLYGCPPWIPVAVAPSRAAMVEKGLWPETIPAEPSKLRNEPPESDEPRTPRTW